jgi:hypothetical protein
MSKLFWFLLFMVLVIIIICRTCVFPLSAGTVDSGLLAAKNFQRQAEQKQLNDYPLVAAIVEPREENLAKILIHFIKVMPAYTHFQVYHGTNNAYVLYDNFKPYIQSGKISLWNLGVDNLSLQGYSALLTSKEFWNTVQSEQVLIFQTDAITCGQSKFKIEDFMDYDFVGAPVSTYISILILILFMGKGYITGHSSFYNGGLSYRTKSKMLAVLDEYPWDQMCTEDIWFCAFLPRVGGVLPTREEARKFSFEAEKLTTTPWGVHKPRKEYDSLCDVCPEIKDIPFVPTHTDYRSLYLL